MILFDHDIQSKYVKAGDVVLRLLESNYKKRSGIFISHKWLLESLPKRLIYSYVYGDLLTPTDSSLKVLDVGGGYCPLTELMRQYHNYTLLDIMAHDKDVSMVKDFLIREDWNETPLLDFYYDLVVANDLFPNVDQRLELFIEKFTPTCKEIRLSITYYNQPKYYSVKRLDADEVFCFLAWSGLQVRSVLEKYASRIVVPDLDFLSSERPSLFTNGRQVCMVQIRGDC